MIETLYIIQGRIGPVDLEKLLASCIGQRNFIYEADNPRQSEYLGSSTYSMGGDFQFHHDATSEGLAL